jgi:hypothetical protein
MTGQSKEKLLKAGYVLYRKRDIPGKKGETKFAIMQCKKFGRWTVLNSYDTKAPRDRQLKNIDELDLAIVEFGD